MHALHLLHDDIRACTLCQERFASTKSNHAPRPVVWFDAPARILIAGQAPGARVHASGKPFTDPSGDRLRDWLGLTEEQFYDRSKVAIVPMAFCFPGYDAKNTDLPPPKICASTWRARVTSALNKVRLTLLVGGHAQKWHLGQIAKSGVTKTVEAWRSCPDGVFPLPHPSWRNTGWLKRNPWFESELLPVVRARVAEEMT